jgi:hypothetical protein
MISRQAAERRAKAQCLTMTAFLYRCGRFRSIPFKSAAVLISLSLEGSPFILKMYATVSTTFFSLRLPGSSGGIELMMVL